MAHGVHHLQVAEQMPCGEWLEAEWELTVSLAPQTERNPFALSLA